MKRWRIENRVSGQALGEFDAETQADALDAWARGEGYRDYAILCEAASGYSDLDVIDIEMLSCDFCGMKVNPGEEVVFAGQKCPLCGRGTLESKGGGS